MTVQLIPWPQEKQQQHWQQYMVIIVEHRIRYWSDEADTKVERNGGGIFVLWWPSLGALNLMCKSEWSSMSKAGLCLRLSYLLICSWEQPEDELHCGNGGSVTKPWPSGAFRACGYTLRKHPQNRSMKTSLMSNTFSFEWKQTHVNSWQIWDHKALLSAFSVSPCWQTWISFRNKPCSHLVWHVIKC